MEWFRWHHGTVTDRKFPVVASRAEARVAEVIAVWACLLEHASQHDDRGSLAGLQAADLDDMDLSLGLVAGKARSIYAAIIDRGLVDGASHRFTAWERRQPRREREEPIGKSTERVRAYRARKADHLRNASGDRETPCNGAHVQQQPREEKSRGEERTVTPHDDRPNSMRSAGSLSQSKAMTCDPVEAAELMREAGCRFANANDPNLALALAEGVTTASLVAATVEALGRRPPVFNSFAWAIRTARNRRAAKTNGVTVGPHATVGRSTIDRVAAHIAAARAEAASPRPET